MKTNPFNICPTCKQKDSCVLTDSKSQVWSCSEYEELAPETRVELPFLSDKKDQAVMALA